jgi:CPA2 family monovalent cation:H+ antiporter-2
LLIATFRKLQALGMLIAEMRVARATAGERTAAIRAVVAQTVLISGVVLLGLCVLMLSSTLLPSLEILLVLLVILALVTWLLWRSFIRIYSQAQIALRDTFAQAPPPRPEEVPPHLAGFLRDADLETVEMAANAPAVGKLIRELELRSRTGASIVAIERKGGERIINPGPDEELLSGDQVLLVGTSAQLASAKTLFSNEPEPGG